MSALQQGAAAAAPQDQTPSLWNGSTRLAGASAVGIFVHTALDLFTAPRHDFAASGGTCAMANISRFLQGRSFDPETIRVMGLAYDKATRGLHDTGQPVLVQEVIAKRIIDIAGTGERNPDQLAKRALEALGVERPG